MTNSETVMLENFYKKPQEEVFRQLLEINADLSYLDRDIALTENQRKLYFDIRNRVKKLLDNK